MSSKNSDTGNNIGFQYQQVKNFYKNWGGVGPVWKERISSARNFLSPFSSHANSYIGIFNIRSPRQRELACTTSTLDEVCLPIYGS